MSEEPKDELEGINEPSFPEMKPLTDTERANILKKREEAEKNNPTPLDELIDPETGEKIGGMKINPSVDVLAKYRKSQDND